MQIWDVDEGALTKYCDGYVVACNGMSTKAGDLGIWDCRRKKKEEDACVTVVDLWKVVRERYPELWSEWKFGGTLLEREEVNIEEPEHTGTCGVKPGYKPWVRDFFAQNGVVVVVLGGMNPSIPTNRQYVSLSCIPQFQPTHLVSAGYSLPSPFPPVPSSKPGNSNLLCGSSMPVSHPRSSSL